MDNQTERLRRITDEKGRRASRRWREGECIELESDIFLLTIQLFVGIYLNSGLDAIKESAIVR